MVELFRFIRFDHICHHPSQLIGHQFSYHTSVFHYLCLPLFLLFPHFVIMPRCHTDIAVQLLGSVRHCFVWPSLVGLWVSREIKMQFDCCSNLRSMAALDCSCTRQSRRA